MPGVPSPVTYNTFKIERLAHYAPAFSSISNINHTFSPRKRRSRSAAWITLMAGRVPLLNGCLANIECSVGHAYLGGDHTVFVGEVEKAAVARGDPLMYFRRYAHAQ
ncbi:MAG: flavin reductase family protein [Blastocatellia bacterium]